ncbi:MAG TPA: polyhydroxyalkanoate granule-associated phasin [Methylibium sp.]|uniref:polyhydroxyalkanoate granule-associated phasin n=1 Tax=Methylibium sp. TaxID=2067992 RepID=UPI002DB9BA10|nr:polyhydroxyalkanoate granule-associated phasin [Methylibium sp.]HEU4459081.1 polyhydroxyalkanoate granule-associated phasin [Methylibium sp.]
MAARRRSTQSLALQSAELAFAAPQVVAHRLTRFAQSGHAPSLADQREWMLMGTEKLAAFNESWIAVGMEFWRIQQRQAIALMSAFTWPWLPKPAAWSAGRAQRDALAMAALALAPVHRRAVANAKRLVAVRRSA